MKIAERAGHNELATGTSNIIDEVTENRKVEAAVIKYLDAAGETVINCTPGRCDRDTDLALGVKKANEAGADIFFSIHFNSFKYTSSVMGTEVLVYSEFPESRRVLNALVGLGFKDRGIKEKPGFYEIRNTKMKAMIIEVCFTDSEADVALYRRLGPDAVGKAIAEAIVGHSIDGTTSTPTPAPEHNRPFEYGVATAISGLYIRNSINGKIIGSLAYGESVHIDFVKDGWASIFWGDHGGWVSMEYIRAKDMYGIVTASALNVRDGASVNAPVLGLKYKGDKVHIGFEQDGWYNIYFGDHGGWVHSKYIDLI